MQQNKRSTPRAAIYARFSTDLQNERSIEDQVSLCRSFAGREQLDVVQVFEDRARSGGSILGRDGLMALMASARNKGFDVLIVEALDRLSRDMEDLAGLHKRLSFHGIEIRAVHEGTVNTVLVGLRGLMGQMYREDNAHKVRRGHAGRVREGLSGGGLTYGYAPVPGQVGKRVIVENEADVVRRIFTEYVAGRSPRDIAHSLNHEGVRPPRGRSWNASTINGHAGRGSGILRNELYAGRLIWNRVRMIKDPDTGKRVSRPNAESEWLVTEVFHLAIVDRALFDAATSRKQAYARISPTYQKRPRHLLSGLLRCGSCGAGMSTNGKDKSGRIRVRCSAAAESGTCPDPKTFYLASIESAVLSGLRAEMRHPMVVAEYVKAYHEERKRLIGASRSQRLSITRRLGELDREIDRLVDAIAKGLGDPAVLGPKATILNEERKRLRAEFEAAPDTPEVIALHPTILARYEKQLASLQECLATSVLSGELEAAKAIRDLVESVTVSRDEAKLGGVVVEIKGRLNSLLGDGAYPNKRKGVWGSMVAEEGLEPPTQGL